MQVVAYKYLASPDPIYSITQSQKTGALVVSALERLFSSRTRDKIRFIQYIVHRRIVFAQ